jgi:hypothetical protein
MILDSILRASPGVCAERGAKMSEKAKRDIVAVYMESPLYFTIPLRDRLELVNRQLFYNNTREVFLCWVKTGAIINSSFGLLHGKELEVE